MLSVLTHSITVEINVTSSVSCCVVQLSSASLGKTFSLCRDSSWNLLTDRLCRRNPSLEVSTARDRTLPRPTYLFLTVAYVHRAVTDSRFVSLEWVRILLPGIWQV